MYGVFYYQIETEGYILCFSVDYVPYVTESFYKTANVLLLVLLEGTLPSKEF
jgi:hypothetical protein